MVGAVPVSVWIFTTSTSIILVQLCCMSNTHYEYHVFKIYFVWHISVCKPQLTIFMHMKFHVQNNERIKNLELTIFDM